MSKPFSAWKEGAPLYVPPTLLGLGVLVLLYETSYVYAAIPLLAFGLFTLFFFRDPPRRITASAQAIVSPADGTIVAVEDLAESPHYDGPCKRISIFLSIFSVHVNRAPAAGTVTKVEHQKGRYKNAMSPESSRVNESNAIWMDTAQGPMTVRQVSGAVARRIVCIRSVGETLAKGQKIGMIKFGSRTELYLPPHAEVTVGNKRKVRAGASIIATMPAAAHYVPKSGETTAHAEP